LYLETWENSHVKTTQSGDRVLVHYVKRFEDGSVTSSRARGGDPLELTVGTDHPRLLGLGRKLVGLAPGNQVALAVPAAEAHGVSDPRRVYRLARSRFRGQTLLAGQRTRLLDRQGRRRVVRVVEVLDRVVVVDANHPRAGQGVEMEVELIAILTPDAPAGLGPAPGESSTPERSPTCNQ
jgi:FKBP-type peptidyl-prolyl cis-trans isomerase SlyD